MKKLNFGCGRDIREGWDNCDAQKANGVITFDFNKFPYPFKDDTYDLIETRSVLQMLNNVDDVLYELRRISKPNALIKILVPYWNNKGAYNDIQTKHFFNENSFINFTEQEPCKIDTKKVFKIKKLSISTTKIGGLFPEIIRKKLDLFVSGLYSNIELELMVLK